MKEQPDLNQSFEDLSAQSVYDYESSQRELQAQRSQENSMRAQRERNALRMRQEADENQSWWREVLDNMWTDDFSAVPVIGPAAKYAASGISTGYQYWDTALTYGISAMPGGLNTFSWEEAGEVAFGQAFIANQAAMEQDGFLWNTASRVQQVLTPGGSNILQLGGVDPATFDVNDAEQRKAVFEDSTVGSIASGAYGATAAFFLDPLIIVGKGMKIYRFGSEALGLAGLSRRDVTQMTSGRIAAEVDEAVKFHTRNTVEILDEAGNVSKTREAQENTVAVMGDAVARGTQAEIRELTWVKSSPYRETIAATGATLTNPVEATYFVGALAGDAQSIRYLQNEAHLVFDALARAKAVRGIEEAYIASPNLLTYSRMRSTALENGIDADRLIADLEKRADFFTAVFRAKGPDGRALINDLGINRIDELGSRFAPHEKFRTAWSMGRANRDLRFQARTNSDEVVGRKDAGRLSDRKAETGEFGYDPKNMQADWAWTEAKKGSRVSAYERTFQFSSEFRRIRLWSWVNGERSAGWVAIRGVQSNNSGVDLRAALTDSKTIRQDKAFLETLEREWGQIISQPGRAGLTQEAVRKMGLEDIERKVAVYFANKYGVNNEVAEAVLKFVQGKRAQHQQIFRANKAEKGRAYGFDVDNSLVIMDPIMVSQLDNALPLLDFQQLEKSIKILSRNDDILRLYDDSAALMAETLAGRTGRSQVMVNIGEEINSLWKASVLFRLGYTQRNVVEGWLRSAAVLGNLPVLKGVPNGMKSVWRNNRMSAQGRARKELSLRLDDMTKQRAALASQLDTVTKQRTALEDRLAKNLDPSVEQVAARNKKIAEQTAKGRIIKNDPVDDQFRTTPQLDDIMAREQAMANELSRMDDVIAKSEMRLESIRKRKGMTDRFDWAAFNDESGDLFKQLSSAQVTQQRFLQSQSRWAVDMELQRNKWVLIKPGQKSYDVQMIAAIKQMRNDQAMMVAIRSGKVEDVARWLRSPEAASYRREMGLDRRTIDERAVMLAEMADAYLPGTLRDLARSGVPDLAAVQRAIKGVGDDALSPIHGNAIADQLGILARIRNQSGKENYRGALNWVFKWLGTKPEDAFVRHPFYNEVWQRRVNVSTANAAKRGLDIRDTAVQRAIANDAHVRALEATKRTLFTIERYSNPAHALRFVAPFFAAWENTTRMWLRTAMVDPSIIPRAAIMFNIPNQMGLVVDKDGNKVDFEFTNFLVSKDKYIVMPEWMAEGMFGDALETTFGTALKIPQASFNVIFPGGNPLSPGTGPMLTMPIGAVLESKPDTQAFLKNVLGETLYEEFVPFGIASSDMTSKLLPPTLRKQWTRWQGENSMEYLAVTSAFMQEAMVDWYRAGGLPQDKPDPEAIRRAADQFFNFSSLASLTLPVSTTRISKYQHLIDEWRSLKESMPYSAAVGAFLDKYGDAYMPLTVSSAQSEARGMDPTLESIRTLKEQPELADELVRKYGPDTLGMLMSTTPLGEFDEGVYNYLLRNDVVPGMKYTKRLLPEEYQTRVAAAGAWREYSRVKMQIDDMLAERGGISLESKAARDIKDVWTRFTNQHMVNKYGSDWVQAYRDWENNTGSYLSAAYRLARDPEFAASPQGQTQVMQKLREYVDMRGAAQAAIANGEDPEEIRAKWKSWVESQIYTSLEWSDFYDNYLMNDSLSIGVA